MQEIMHVYLRWYDSGRPMTGPLLMTSESAARAAVLERFPEASFSERRKTIHEPTVQLSGIEEVMFVWPEPKTQGLNAVADILFPLN